jgi:peptide/nickel transport system substrate-binding protein
MNGNQYQSQRPRVAQWVVLLLLIAAAALALPASTMAQGRTGAWVDSIVVLVEPSFPAAVSRLEANDIQVYFSSTVDPAQRDRIARNPALASDVSYGLFWEISFNPVGPLYADGTRLNPFAVPRVREAMNWLVNRRHIVDELMGGMARARWLPINTAFPDYARLADTARRLEITYGHNPDRARTVIAEEMGRLGATMVGGRWQFRGAPVSITFLIRTEDERRAIGDYVAGLLEGIGFTVERRYGTAAVLSPIWMGGPADPAIWKAVTGGWISTVVDRDQADNFNFFYTPRGRPEPLWQAYRPAPAFDTLADRLARSDFTTVAARNRMMAEALEHSVRDGVRLWIAERVPVWPRRAELRLASDLAGGYSGSWLWPLTIRYEGRTGGTVRIGTPNVLVEPWNPIAGSNWIFDMTFIRATQDSALLPDPFTGLWHPQRLERAEVWFRRDLPVSRTLDWVTLRPVPEIRVPAEAFISWDHRAQRFITVGERHPEGLTARTRTVLHFERDLFRNAQWHDGSPLSMGDIMLESILWFDRATEGSAIFDPAHVPAFRTWERDFRGFRIISERPLVVEFYTDTFFTDAELIANNAAALFWPNYDQGPGAWHNLALGIRAEAARELAFSSAKATRERIEWMSFIAGPSIAILDRHLAAARAENFIPYAPTLGRFITADEARARWANLAGWRGARGHFWIGTGAFQLQRVAPVERIVELHRFARFPDPATRWIRFDAPKLAAVAVTGPATVRVGAEAAFDIRVTHAGRPYPPAEIERVRWLLFDARDNLTASGDAARVGDVWRAALPTTATDRLVPGASRLEVVVVSRVVAIPSFATASFTVLPR